MPPYPGCIRTAAIPPGCQAADLRFYDTFTIQWRGQFSTQLPQLVHLSKSIRTTLPSIFMACSGQFFMHFIQLMHPASHSVMTTLPLSEHLHLTRLFWS